MIPYFTTATLLICSNVFMTFAQGTCGTFQTGPG